MTERKSGKGHMTRCKMVTFLQNTAFWLILIANLYLFFGTSEQIGEKDGIQDWYERVIGSPTASKQFARRLTKDGEFVSFPFPARVATQFGDINKTGWRFWQVASSRFYSDEDRMFWLSQDEGSMTAGAICEHWHNTLANYCSEDPGFCRTLEGFLSANLQWMRTQISANPSDPYWHQVDMTLIQLKGLRSGFLKGKPANCSNITEFDFLLMQVEGDLDGLEQALGRKTLGMRSKTGSCSALVKLAPDNEDLYVGHDTWGPYNAMYRIFKVYDLLITANGTGQEIIPGQKVIYSSYPGKLTSMDDFYMLSNSGLVVMETSLSNYNTALWKHVVPEGTVLTWLRASVANRLATSGKQWAQIFAKYNSGTCNNQWMIVDYKQFTPGQKLKPGALWILEQLPGYVRMADMTSLLEAKGYWASYNIPYFADIYTMSGLPALVKKYGTWFTYQLNPRAQIFKRDHGKVVDVESMIKLMRYNDFKHDPLARCNCTPPYSAENAISARSDLNPSDGKYPFSFLGHRNHGGTDCKVTSYKIFQREKYTYSKCYAVSGPTHQQQPAFQWSRTEWTKPLALPDQWDFKPVLVEFMQLGPV